MTRIWTESGFIENDPWVLVEDSTAAGIGRENSSLIRHLSELAEAGSKTDGQGGVVLSPADDVELLAPYLDRLALVAVTFPAFSDGRAFSQATLLRQRYGFTGEIRAVGDVLIDQIPLMLRCGITSFAVTNPVAIKRLEDGRLNGIALHYQPATRSAPFTGSFSWRRKSHVA